MAHDQKSVEELFEEAIARPREERLAYLQDACADSPDVRQVVEMLLRADERAGSFLETPLLSTSDLSGLGAGRESRLESQATFEAGAVVAGRFRIHRFIARGGMGEVYEAWDTELRERVALKTIRPELAQHPEVLERFRREVKQARAISHPNVCRVHELFCEGAGSETKIWFLSMEFLDGFTLSEYIRHHGPIKPALALDLLDQIVKGLTAAHAMGVIHRDLKTGNILLVSGALGNQRAVITDFGLAINVLYRDGVISEPGGQGTPEFMAPEQKKTGKVSALADQYALGVILCEMLTGSRPTGTETAQDRLRLQTTVAKSADPRWARVILRCLEQDPKDRFDRLEEIVPALRPARRSGQPWMWPAFAALLALAIAVGLWYSSRRVPQPASLAVLPLENRTGDPSLEYLGAGITEALTDDLARMPRLQVTAGSIARRYQGEGIDPTAAGRQMNVRFVLTGSIENFRGQMRVPIEVIDVKTGHELWGQTYKAGSDIAELQHEISTDVAYRQQAHVDANMAARLKRQYSTNSNTYRNYLKGRFQLAKRSPDALREAVLDFQQALGSDSHYAPAYAGLADCYSLIAFYGLERPKPVLEQAMRSSQQALELDSTLGEAYTSRALARTFLNFDWQGAEDDYKRSFELNPTYLQAHTWYALLLLAPQGRLAEARAQMTYAQAADPDSALTKVGTAMLEQYAGNYDKSIETLEPYMHDPAAPEPAVEILAVDYLAKHNTAKAIETLSATPAPEFAYSRDALLAAAYARTGQMSKAREGVKQAVLRLHQGNPIAYDTAVIYTALNDPKDALDVLQYAFDERESDLVWVDVDPLLASLRTEQRFHDLLTEMNLQ
ncbi:MAG TPA: protein kinase [Acidobacteriaceae bacterium]|nr:protein kinase [Acidobacteriaceae bacterium]